MHYNKVLRTYKCPGLAEWVEYLIDKYLKTFCIRGVQYPGAHLSQIAVSQTWKFVRKWNYVVLRRQNCIRIKMTIAIKIMHNATSANHPRGGGGEGTTRRIGHFIYEQNLQCEAVLRYVCYLVRDNQSIDD